MLIWEDRIHPVPCGAGIQPAPLAGWVPVSPLCWCHASVSLLQHVQLHMQAWVSLVRVFAWLGMLRVRQCWLGSSHPPKRLAWGPVCSELGPRGN